MRRATFFIAAIAVSIALQAVPALAQNVRTFVSGSGSDSNPSCGRSTPCRTFAQAISLTNAGGEIVVLDSAGYGTLTISKAITITAIGVEAAITATSGDAITINAGASDVVTLRALTLTGNGGNNGITFNSGGTLNIQNCVVRGFTQQGLNLIPNTSSKTNVSDTVVANNGQSGIYFGPSASGAAFFERVEAIGNSQGSGFFVDGSNASVGATIKAVAANSAATEDGFGASLETGSASAMFMIVNSEVFQNNSGIGAFTNGGSTAPILIIGNSKVYKHPFSGFQAFNLGIVESFGNNYFANNAGNFGFLTPIAQQ